jgi:hypothetical protein
MFLRKFLSGVYPQISFKHFPFESHQAVVANFAGLVFCE